MSWSRMIWSGSAASRTAAVTCGGVQLLPVPGIDGPLDHRRPDQGPVRLVHGAVRRSEPVVSRPQQRLQRLLCAPHLLPERVLGNIQEPHMVPGVAAHLMTLRGHPFHQILAAGDLTPDEKEGRPGPPVPEAVQQPLRGVSPGAVVKGDGDELLRRDLRRAIRRRRRAGRRAARCQRQAQAEDRQPFSPHIPRTSLFLQGIVCAEARNLQPAKISQ